MPDEILPVGKGSFEKLRGKAGLSGVWERRDIVQYLIEELWADYSGSLVVLTRLF